MNIDVRVIETVMGKVSSGGDQLSFLTEAEKGRFDDIGYTGVGDREDYLNSLGKGQFKVRTLVSGRITEKFIVVRVTEEKSS